DEALTEELSDDAGQVTADANGVFPTIYMQVADYRVRLHEANGVLVWDVDPYLCDCGELTAIVFRDPVNHTIDDDDVAIPGAELLFSVASGTTPVDTYADGERSVPHPNPLQADAAGRFPTVYLDDEVTIRARLYDADGNELADIDPYVCECQAEPPAPTSVIVVVSDSGSANGAIVSADRGATWANPSTPERQWSGVAFAPSLGSGKG